MIFFFKIYTIKNLIFQLIYLAFKKKKDNFIFINKLNL
jgi:hypothetical protein